MNNNEVMVQSEGVKFALDFLRNPNIPIEDLIRQGDIAFGMLIQRRTEIDMAKGITDFAIGGVISRFSEKENWKNWPQVEEWWVWGDFCRTVLGMSLSKANILKRNWERAQEIGMEAEEVGELGWNCTRAILARARSRKDVDKLLGEFRNSPTNSEFLENLKSRVENDGRDPEMRTEARTELRSVHLTKEEAAFFDETIEHAAGVTNRLLSIGTTQHECLMYIFTQWRHFVGR